MPYQVVTLDELQTRLSHRVEDQPWWTPDQARRAINEGLRIWNLITGMWTEPFAATIQPGEIPTPISGLLVKSTRVTQAGRWLDPTSQRGLDLSIPGWINATVADGPPAPNYVAYWAPIGLTSMIFYPFPIVPTPIVVDGVCVTTPLVDPTDYLDLGEEEVSTLLGYAFHVLSFTKGIAAIRATLPLKTAFFIAAARRNAVFASSTVYQRITGVDRSRWYRPMEAPLELPPGMPATPVTPPVGAPLSPGTPGGTP